MSKIVTSGTEFERWFETDWPVMLNEKHRRASQMMTWEACMVELWREAGGLGVWVKVLAATKIPPEAWSHPAADRQDSWDRRAAYLVYSLLRPAGKTINESTDLFG